MTSTFFSSIVEPLASTVSSATTPPLENKSSNAVEILEKKIFHLELDRLHLNFVDYNPAGVNIVDDSIQVQNIETRFRRVSLSESNYNVGWVVDGDVNNCMCCGFFLFLIGKYHCRSCGNIVCDSCSPYIAHIASLDEPEGSRICSKCFHELLKDQFTERKFVPSLQEEACLSPDIDSPTTRRKRLLVTIVEENSSEANQVLEKVGVVESKTRTSSGFDSTKPSQLTVAQFYLDPLSGGKAAKYLRSASERSISVDTDEHITVIASKSMKSLISPRVSDSRQLSNETNTSSLFKSSYVSENPYGSNTPSRRNSNESRISGNSNYGTAGEKLVPKDKFIKAVKEGDAYKAQSILNYGCEPIPKEEINQLLHYCLDNISKLLSPDDTFVILVERCDADVNAVDENGDSPLMKLVRMNQQNIGSYFIFFRSADALQVHTNGECPLSVALSQGRSWVLSEFQLNQEELLFFSGDLARIRRYIACLVIAGHSSLVERLIDIGKAQIDEDEAIYLYEECRKNKKNLLDPKGTFELLHYLGAPRND